MDDKFNWANMTDKQLTTRLEEEIRRSKRSINPRDRAMARSNIEQILKEQTRRYEVRWNVE